MGYSVYVIVPKDISAQVLGCVRNCVKTSEELFGEKSGFRCDASAHVAVDAELSYANRNHKKQGTLVGFNYSCPDDGVREHLMATLAVLARTVGRQHSFNKVQRPTFYYDGEPVAIFADRDEARNSGVREWDVRDEDGIHVAPAKTGVGAVMGFFSRCPAREIKLIREETKSLRAAMNVIIKPEEMADGCHNIAPNIVNGRSVQQ